MDYVSDGVVEIVVKDGKRYIKSEAAIEEISRENYADAYKEVLRNKPKQFSLGEFQIRHCDKCMQEFVLHKKQTFCPICKDVIEVIKEDANYQFDEFFKKWQEDKNFLENILQGNEKAVLYIEEEEEPIEEVEGWGESDIISDGPKVEEL